MVGQLGDLENKVLYILIITFLTLLIFSVSFGSGDSGNWLASLVFVIIFVGTS